MTDLLEELRSNYGAFFLAQNPGYGYAHFQQEIIAPALEKVVLGKINRLMLFLPFRASKSDMVTCNFIPWYMGHYPTHTVISLSYGHKLAQEFGRKVRNYMSTDLYAALFPHSIIRKDSRAKDDFMTEAGGQYHAAGFSGTINGLGCIAEGQRVLTEVGWVPIERVRCEEKVVTPWGVQAVTATRCTGTKPTICIGIGSNSLRLTDDHRILTESGWVPAGQLRRGDNVYISMRAVRQGVRSEVVAKEEDDCSSVFGCVPFGMEPEAIRGGARDMPHLREAEEAVLVGNLFAPVRRSARTADGKSTDVADGDLSHLQENISPPVAPHSFLFHAMQERRTRGLDDGKQQPQLHQWVVGDVLPPAFQEAALPSTAPAIWEMLRVRKHGELRRASHGREQAKRHRREHCDSLQLVSHPISQIQEAGDSRVYDLQVESDHCFITEGFVTHNCHLLVVDDPCKNRQEAMSETIRKRDRDIYTAVMRTRLEPNANIIMVTTRWTPGDLPGWRIEEDGAWDYLRDCPYVDPTIKPATEDVHVASDSDPSAR